MGTQLDEAGTKETSVAAKRGIERREKGGEREGRRTEAKGEGQRERKSTGPCLNSYVPSSRQIRTVEPHRYAKGKCLPICEEIERK